MKKRNDIGLYHNGRHNKNAEGKVFLDAEKKILTEKIFRHFGFT